MFRFVFSSLIKCMAICCALAFSTHSVYGQGRVNPQGPLSPSYQARMRALSALFGTSTTAASTTGPYISPSWSNFSGPSFSANTRVLGAYFFGWYSDVTKGHIVLPNGTDALTEHPDYTTRVYSNRPFSQRPPAVYSPSPQFHYGDRAWYERELRRMSTAGIDIAVFVDFTEGDASRQSLQTLNAAALSLIGQGVRVPRIALMYSRTLLQGINLANNTNDFERFYRGIRDVYSQLHPSLWARRDGKVLVWMYSAGDILGSNGQIGPAGFNYASQRFASEFGGTQIRYVANDGYTSRGVPAVYYEWGASVSAGANKIQGYDIAQIAPGHNYRDQRVVSRNNGQLYRNAWAAALNSGKKWIFIETWNEFHEGTEVCHSFEWGNTYYELTRHFAADHHSR